MRKERQEVLPSRSHDRQEALRRFYRVLVREFRSRPPWDLRAQFYLSDLYNSLVPFQVWGEELGLETEAEYDHVLMRLLAGEGDYLRLGSEKVRREMKEELAASHPILEAYRDFAATELRLNPERTEEILASEDAAGSETDPGGDVPEGQAESHIQAHAEGNADGNPEGEAGLPEPQENPAEVPEAVAAKGPCIWCGTALPNRKRVNFCPFCGKSVLLFPCPACREALERDWRFCISCGMEVRPAADA